MIFTNSDIVRAEVAYRSEGRHDGASEWQRIEGRQGPVLRRLRRRPAPRPATC